MKIIFGLFILLSLCFCSRTLRADTGCKSYSPNPSYPIYTSKLGVYSGKTLYDFFGNRITFTDFNCLKDTGRGCFIRITDVSQCTDGCVNQKDAAGFYYKPGIEYEFDASNPKAMCDLDSLIILLIGAATGFEAIKRIN